MKRVLVISRNYPPLLGGMERLNLHLVDELSRRFEVRVIAPEGAAKFAPPGVNVTQIQLRPLHKFLLGAVWQSMREVKTWSPDIIIAGSGLTAPLALLCARRCGAKALAYVHGLDLTVPHPIYRALWIPAIRKLDGILANSAATAQLAKNIGISQNKINIVHPGVSMPAKIDSNAEELFRSKFGLSPGPILLSVGRLAARKGLREFVVEVLPHVVNQYPSAMLVLIGTPPADALYAIAQTQQSIQAAANDAGVGENVRFLGSVDNSTLYEAYAGADVHVFPVRMISRDPEGFGMVALEAAAYGLPTVAYAAGGIVDAVSDGVSGSLVEPGNAAAFAGALLNLIAHPLNKEEIKAFAKGFSWRVFGEQVCNAIQSI